MQTGYYSDQIKEYTTEEQFWKHGKALNDIERYYDERDVSSNAYESKRKIASERNLLSKYYRKLKKKEKKTAHE